LAIQSYSKAFVLLDDVTYMMGAYADPRLLHPSPVRVGKGTCVEILTALTTSHHFFAGCALFGVPRVQVPELDSSPAAAAAAHEAPTAPRPPDAAPPRAGGVVW
jgi:hypothetical protein